MINLFGPTQKLYPRAPQPLTINGIHLNQHGDREVAGIIDRALFGAPAPVLPEIAM